jgi:ABC-type transport system substrate-binding protein
MEETPFKFVFWANPESYDPHKSDGMESMSIAKNIYAPLVSTFLDGKAQGMIAEKWEVSKDGKTWRFKIRKGVTFADGSSITPEIVLANFRRILWLTKESGLALNMALPELRDWQDYSAPLKSVYVDGEFVVFRFRYQPASLFETLEKPLYGIAHPKCFGERGEWREKACLNESGQYKIEKKFPDRLILRNRHIYPEVKGAPEVVEFITQVPAGKARFEWAMEIGADMSFLGTLSVGKIETEIISKGGYRLLQEPPLRMHYLRLNHRRAPFNDKKLRQSVRDTFLYLLSKNPDFNSEIRLDPSFVPPGGMGYVAIDIPGLPVKIPPAKGAEILALLSPAAPPEKPVTKIDKFLKALEASVLKTMDMHGIKVNISRDYSKAYERTKSGYFDLMFNYSGMSVQEPYEALLMMFMSDVGACIPDPSGKIPGYIRKGHAANDPKIRKQVAEKINMNIFEEAAAITFTHSGFVYLHSSDADVSRINTFSDPVEFRAISRASK